MPARTPNPTPAQEARRLARARQRHARREAAMRLERSAGAVELLLELHGVTTTDVVEWARRHRLPLPLDRTLPRPVVEFYLLATRHRGPVQIGGRP